MAERGARLEELRKIVGFSTAAELEKSTRLSLCRKSLTSVPLGVFDLTDLVNLWLDFNQLSSLPPEISLLRKLALLDVGDNKLSSLPPEIQWLTELTALRAYENQLSSLPPEISQLKKLSFLGVFSNPIEELPLQITALKDLKKLYIQDGKGKVHIKRAPRGITNLPCWNNTEDKYGDLFVGDALRKLQLCGASSDLPSDPNPDSVLASEAVGVTRLDNEPHLPCNSK